MDLNTNLQQYLAVYAKNTSFNFALKKMKKVTFLISDLTGICMGLSMIKILITSIQNIVKCESTD